ncbi:unnamed protein product [Aphanomyces euteiches]
MTLPDATDAVRRTCLDAQWVASTAANLKIDPKARDPSTNRKLYPWLRPTLPTARFRISDPRFTSSAYSSNCVSSTYIYGVGASIDAAGRVLQRGKIEGTLVAEWAGWPSHQLTSYVNSILVQEVLGYDVSFAIIDYSPGATERMSTAGQGLCTPTHVNPEIWSEARIKILNVYANETTSGIIGYWGRTGHYTLQANVNIALQGKAGTLLVKGFTKMIVANFSKPLSADFWREYAISDDLINFYSIDKHNRSLIANKEFCPDDTMGCKNGCSKSFACTLAERAGKTCMLVLFMRSSYDSGYIQAFISNNNVPAYFCFVGDSQLESYVVDTMDRNGTLTFYHYEPHMFHFDHPGQFARIFWPLPNPAVVASSTSSFGERGYGNETTNPVNVDFPQQDLAKYYSNVLHSDAFLTRYLDRLRLTQLDINTMLQTMSALQKNTSNPDFVAACSWVKANYNTWQAWLDPLPLCDLIKHINYTLSGCDGSSRVVRFQWAVPDPTNSSLPYVCDGGHPLPRPLSTSRSCAWLETHREIWMSWAVHLPTCDASFYSYTVSPCRFDSTRLVTYGWFMTQGLSSMSAECVGGVSLPANEIIPCDYVPGGSQIYIGIAIFASSVAVGLVVLTALVVRHRENPVIKRSQWPLLVSMLGGGLLLCCYVLLGGGLPSSEMCGVRLLLGSLGYTLVFGSLFVKSLRVFWVFYHKPLKRKVVPLSRVVHIFMVVIAIDCGIVLLGLAVDYPHPLSTNSTTNGGSVVGNLQCDSSDVIFLALSIFYKGLITCWGLYIAFLIRHADSDFQETVWIFASSCVVVGGSTVMLALAFVGTLSVATTYAFQSVVILLCTIAVMALMLVPKFRKLSGITPLTDEQVSGTSTASSTSWRVFRQKSNSKSESWAVPVATAKAVSTFRTPQLAKASQLKK